MGLLPNVVRLADYMLVEGALDMLVEAIEAFRALMETHPVITAQLSFAEAGMSLNANEEEARQAGRLWGGRQLSGVILAYFPSPPHAITCPPPRSPLPHHTFR